MVISRSPEGATGQPGCQEYLTSERCRIRETFAVNACERRCLRYGTADGAAAGGGRASEPAGRCGDAAGARPPQPAPASASAAVSTAGTTTARILVMPAEPTRPGDWPPGEPGQYRVAVLAWTDGDQRAAVTARA